MKSKKSKVDETLRMTIEQLEELEELYPPDPEEDASLQKAIDDAFEEVARKRKEGRSVEQIVEEAREAEAKPINIYHGENRILSALFNINNFDMKRFKTWLDYQPSPIKTAVSLCPPNKLYMHEDGFLCSIYGYSKYNGKMILKLVDIDGEIRDVSHNQIKDVTNEMMLKYGVSTSGS